MKCWLFDCGEGLLPIFAETRNKAAFDLERYFNETGHWPDYIGCKAMLKRQKQFDQFANAPGVSTYDDGVNEVPDEAWIAAGYTIRNEEEF